MPAARTFSTIAASLSRPAAPVSPKPALIDQERLDPFGDAIVDDGGDLIAGNGDDRKRNLPVDGGHARDRRHAFDLAAGHVDRHDASAKTAGNEIVKNFRADAAAPPARPDYGDHVRPEEGRQRRMRRRT